MAEPASALPAAHAALLTAIQNMSADIRNTVDRGRFGWDRLDLGIAQGWRHQLDHLNDALGIVTSEAVAIGVPRRLIEHVRERGANGIRWHSNQMMPVAEAVERGQLLARLGTQIGRLEEMAAVHAAYTHRYSDYTGEPQTWFQSSMKALREHIGTLAHTLDLTTAEREQLWPTVASIGAATTRAHGLDDDALTERWHSRARMSNLIAESLPMDVLHAAGITVADAEAAEHLPPGPRELIAVAEAALDTATTTTADADPAAGAASVRAGDGAAIEAAIHKAGLSTDTPTAQPEETTDLVPNPMSVSHEQGLEL